MLCNRHVETGEWEEVVDPESAPHNNAPPPPDSTHRNKKAQWGISLGKLTLGRNIVMAARKQIKVNNTAKVAQLKVEVIKAEEKATKAEAEAEFHKNDESTAFAHTQATQMKKGRNAWQLVRARAQEASKKAIDLREAAEYKKRESKDAQAKAANDNIYASNCDSPEEIGFMVRDHVLEEVRFGTRRWDLTRSRVLAGAVIQHEAKLAIKMKDRAQRAGIEATQVGTSADIRTAKKEESQQLWSEANKRVGMANALTGLEAESAEFTRERESESAKYVRQHALAATFGQDRPAPKPETKMHKGKAGWGRLRARVVWGCGSEKLEIKKVQP